MSDLETHRKEIDRIDAEIITLIAQRKKQVEGVIEAKRQTGTQALQPARFEAVLEKCRTRAEANDIDPDVIEEIWHALHNYFLRLEKEALNQ